MINVRSLLGAGAGLLLSMTAANAATITQFGTDVSFTYDDSTLFGTGIVVANNIFFVPTDFVVESLDGAGLDTLTDTLNITVMSTTDGFEMDMFRLAENGDYRLDGAPTADVDASAFLQIISQTTICGGGICSANDIFDAGALANTGGVLTGWDLAGDIDLADTVDWGSDTKVTLQLQNNLLATTSNAGEIAFIQKKFGSIGIEINPIPVPAAVWLFGSGLLGLVGMARRKKA